MVSTALLISGIRLMHQGIEIGHPVYAILFNNLLVTLIACLVEIVLLLMPTATRPESMIKACSIFSGLFHIYSWLLVSMLRYIYIIHIDWIDDKFSEPKRLTKLCVLAVHLVYLTNMSVLLTVLVVNNWPLVEVTAMEMAPKTICSLLAFSSYMLPLSVSCIFHCLILYRRGVIGRSTVGVAESNTTKVCEPNYVDVAKRLNLHTLKELFIIVGKNLSLPT